jgi:hypothetical protein
MSVGVFVLIILNAVASLAGTGFAIIAALRPSVLSHDEGERAGERFYAWMYAVRGVPLGLLATVIPFFSVGIVPSLVLLAATVAQAGDAVIGAHRRELRQLVGAALAAIIHLLAAIAIAQ